MVPATAAGTQRPLSQFSLSAHEQKFRNEPTTRASKTYQVLSSSINYSLQEQGAENNLLTPLRLAELFHETTVDSGATLSVSIQNLWAGLHQFGIWKETDKQRLHAVQNAGTCEYKSLVGLISNFLLPGEYQILKAAIISDALLQAESAGAKIEMDEDELNEVKFRLEEKKDSVQNRLSELVTAGELTRQDCARLLGNGYSI